MSELDAGTSTVSIPMKVTTRTVFGPGTDRLKFPSRSVMTPTVSLPFSATAAPMTGSPLLSTTTPFAVNR